MKNNAIMPYILIMVLGIALIFVLSIKGIGDADKKADEEKNGGKDKTEQTADSGKPEDIYKSKCLSCHGDQYQGVVGPKLTGVGERIGEDGIKETIKNGRGIMPANLVPEDKLDEMTEWLSTL